MCDEKNKLLKIMFVFLSQPLMSFVTIAGDAIDFNKLNIIDLTHTFDANTIAWPTEKSGFELKPSFKGITKSGFLFFQHILFA